MTARFGRVVIAVDAVELSRWVIALATMIEQRIGAVVVIRAVRDDGHAPPRGAVDMLLALEALVLRRGKATWSDRLGWDDLDRRFVDHDVNGGVEGEAPDLVLDLSSAGAGPCRGPLLRPLYSGRCGETGLVAALFFEGTPKIEIESEIAGSTGIISGGVASLEAAEGLGGAMEAVWSRTALLLCQSLDRLEKGLDTGAAVVLRPAQDRMIDRKDVSKRVFRMVVSMAARRAYRLCCHAPHWRIGWRFVENGQDVWSRRSLDGAQWNVLADPNDHFYADPFPISRNGRDYLFFEDLDHKTGKGVISFTMFDEDHRPGTVEVVLEEPWHLSYPHLIEMDGQIWMLPEASLSGNITLYRASDFPRKWEPHAVLVSGVEAADATIVQHDGKLWMFAVVRNGIGGYSDTLAIWVADRLHGPWTPISGNPVLIDDRSARPAGNFVKRNGLLMRPVQDCRKTYGAALGLARIDRLDADGFSQVIETSLAPGPHWPGRKLHSLNGNGNLEVIDGSVLRPRSRLAAGAVDWLYRPR